MAGPGCSHCTSLPFPSATAPLCFPVLPQLSGPENVLYFQGFTDCIGPPQASQSTSPPQGPVVTPAKSPLSCHLALSQVSGPSLVASLVLTTPQHPGIKDEDTAAARCSRARERRADAWWRRAHLLSPSPPHLCAVICSPRALFRATLPHQTGSYSIPNTSATCTKLPVMGHTRFVCGQRNAARALSCQHRVI